MAVEDRRSELVAFPVQRLRGGVWVASAGGRSSGNLPDPGLYTEPRGSTQEDEPGERVGQLLLGGEILPLEVAATNEDDEQGESRIRIRVSDGRQHRSIWLTQESCETGRGLNPLSALDVTLPEKRDRGRLWRLLNQIAHRAQLLGADVVWSSAVPHYGWHEHELPGVGVGQVAVFANGVVGPHGQIIPPPFRVSGSSEEDRQTVTPSAPGDLELRRAREALELALSFDGPGDTRPPTFLYRLLTGARVAWPPASSKERDLGTAPYLLEVWGSSGSYKTSGDNLACRMFSGHDYGYDAGPDLVPENTKRGNDGTRGTFRHMLCTCSDAWAPPGDSAWNAQQDQRSEFAHGAGSHVAGRTVSSRTGGRVRRPRPAGALLRTAEHDSRSLSIARNTQGVEWRVISTHAGERAEVEDRLDASKRLFGELAPTLDAMRERFWQWLAGATFADWPARRESYAAAADERLRAIEGSYHGRVEERLRYMLEGAFTYADFLRSIDQDEAAELLLSQVARMIDHQLADAAWLAGEQMLAQGGLTEPERIRTALGEALRALFREGRLHTRNQDGEAAPPTGMAPTEVGLSEIVGMNDTRFSARSGSVAAYLLDDEAVLAVRPAHLRELLMEDPRFRTYSAPAFTRQLRDAGTLAQSDGYHAAARRRVGGQRERLLMIRANLAWDEVLSPLQTGDSNETGDSKSPVDTGMSPVSPMSPVENVTHVRARAREGELIETDDEKVFRLALELARQLGKTAVEAETWAIERVREHTELVEGPWPTSTEDDDADDETDGHGGTPRPEGDPPAPSDPGGAVSDLDADAAVPLGVAHSATDVEGAPGVITDIGPSPAASSVGRTVQRTITGTESPSSVPLATPAPRTPRRTHPSDQRRSRSPRAASEATPMRIGALDERGLWIEYAEEAIAVDLETIDSAADVLRLALEHELRQLAVHPELHERFGLPAEVELRADVRDAPDPHPFFDPAMTRTRGRQVGRGGCEAWVYWSPPGGGFYEGVDLLFAAWDDSAAGLRDARDGRELVQALCRFRDSLHAERQGRGLAYRQTPGATVAKLVFGKGGKSPGPSGPHPPVAQDGALVSPFYWWREPTAEELQLPHVIRLDINFQYPAAARSLPVGIGQPVHFTGPEADRAWREHKSPAGYVRTREALEILDMLTPDPFNPRRDAAPGEGPSEHWYPAPLIALADELGLDVEIAEAWIYPESRRALDRFAKQALDARTMLLELEESEEAGARLARDLLKSGCASLTGGWFISGSKQPGDDDWRPDWRHHIHARANANAFRALRRAGVAPLAIYRDEIYVPYPHAEPRDGEGGLWIAGEHPGVRLPSDRLVVSRQAGKWKPAGSRPAVEAFETLERTGLGGLRKLFRDERGA